MRGARRRLTHIPECPIEPDIPDTISGPWGAGCGREPAVEQSGSHSCCPHLVRVATSVGALEQTNHMRLPLDNRTGTKCITNELTNNLLIRSHYYYYCSPQRRSNQAKSISGRCLPITITTTTTSTLTSTLASTRASTLSILLSALTLLFVSTQLLLWCQLQPAAHQPTLKLLLPPGAPSLGQVIAYQLTNNIIANNLPPRFVTGSSPGSSSSSGSHNSHNQMHSSAASSSGSSSEIVVRVKEGASNIGKLIYQLKAEDPDDDTLTFGVLGSLAADLLRIENVAPNQANVYLRKELDRETTDSYQVIITLTDGKLGKGNWITKSMLIIVEDINDNYPVFGPYRTAITIPEDSRAPLVVETVEANDQDEGRFGQVVYRLEEIDNKDNSASNMFAIDTQDGKGVISLIGELDFEQKSLYQLRILAIDRAIENERLTATASILISVEDCQDQAPIFTFVPSITRIPENLPVGSQVVRVAAVDGDRGINNPILYRLQIQHADTANGPALFQINAHTGLITVAGPLDREQQSARGDTPLGSGSAASQQQAGAYVLQVEAREEGASQQTGAPTSVTTELTVLLTDVNDQIPTFNRRLYYGEILENSPPESLVNLFISGHTSASPAAPGGTPTTGSGDLWTGSVGQQQQQQQQLAQVIDRDQGTNGSFYLSLEGDFSDLFDIWPHEATNEANFMIKVRANPGQNHSGALDYERNKMFQFTLVAREKTGPADSYPGVDPRARSSEAQITIYLKDANDNFPQFDSALYRVEVPENAIRGMHICQVKALDADSGIYGSAGIRYTEIRGEKASRFSLDPQTGFISLNSAEHGFDRETIGRHHLIVEARDYNGLGNRNTTQLVIVVADVNDQAPKFLLDRYEARIYENEPDFQSPLQVQAHDADQANTINSRITYSIVAGDSHHNFTIDPQTGRIRVRAPIVEAAGPDELTGSAAGEWRDHAASAPGEPGLDFEGIAQRRDETKQFNLTVRASDQGRPEPLHSDVQVIVLVYDKNDHAPQFTRPVYSKTIAEDIKEGSQVIQVQAQDGDHSPSNSKIHYRLASGGADKFVIDADTGMISIATGANLDIDRETQRRTQYLLNVLALDGSFGPQQKSASALVNISVSDVNNKGPEFVSLGASLAGPPSVVAASPGLTASLPGTSTSSQHPLASTTGTSVYVNEDAPYGQLVTRVLASDPDVSAQLRYSINWGQSEARNEDMAVIDGANIRDIFFIEPIDGTIKVAKPLDRELCDQIKLRLQVEDVAAQTLNQVAQANLLVRITDVNDNRPTFKRPLYKAVVNENSIIGTSVITITAEDRDLNKTLKYTLDGQHEMTRLVRIGTRTGEITVNDKIDRETHPLINVTIRAEDYGQPQSLTGTTQLLITVRDENDNNPVFVNSTIRGQHQHQHQHQHHHLHYPHQSHLAAGTGPAPRRLGGQHPLAPNHNSHHSLEPLINEMALASETTSSTNSGVSNGELTTPSTPPARETDQARKGVPFLAPNSNVTVSEDTPIGQRVAYVLAEDADSGFNARITYLLDGASVDGKFRVDRDSGLLTVAGALDREERQQYTFIVEACDNYDYGYSTGESRRAFAQFTIFIGDVNDNAPVILDNMISANSPPATNTRHSSRASQRATPTRDTGHMVFQAGPNSRPLSGCALISEFHPINEPIMLITATDADDPATPNGQIELSMIASQDSDLFAIVPIAYCNLRRSAPINL